MVYAEHMLSFLESEIVEHTNQGGYLCGQSPLSNPALGPQELS